MILYRCQFGDTMEEHENGPTHKVFHGEPGTFFFGVCVVLAVSFAAIEFGHHWMAPTMPSTITPEWRAAAEEKAKVINPEYSVYGDNV